MREVSILINRANQKEVQKYLIKNGFKWRRFEGNFYDCFNDWDEQEERYINIRENNRLTVSHIHTYSEIIDGEQLTRRDKIKKLL